MVSNADSVGWLFKRLYDLLKELHDKNKLGKYFNALELHRIKHGLEKSIHGVIKNYSEGELIKNKNQETWCDTKICARDGMRIEIQAMQLNMYKFLGWLCSLLRDRGGKKYAAHKEEVLRSEVFRKFWNGHYLNDGANDNTIRPNVFLAYYIYPDLLSDSQWRKCFDNVLPRLFTGFGLSSIDMHSPKFRELHTGATDESYHNGDSWYWINNIAAICLYRFGKFRYAKYIHSILKGSTNDLLWQGIPGCASEISSAKKQEAFGCFNQAWSDSTYVEMVGEMF
jgi:glycogen debranching enzyme